MTQDIDEDSDVSRSLLADHEFFAAVCAFELRQISKISLSNRRCRQHHVHNAPVFARQHLATETFDKMPSYSLSV